MSANTVPVLEIRRRLGRSNWGVPTEFGPAGWRIEHLREPARIMVTDGPAPEGDGVFRHASFYRPDRMPDYDDLVTLHKAVWGNGWAYQVFAPPAHHVNINGTVLHLWGRPDGRPMLPNFGANGTI